MFRSPRGAPAPVIRVPPAGPRRAGGSEIVRGIDSTSPEPDPRDAAGIVSALVP
jgi:hypothetical protein